MSVEVSIATVTGILSFIMFYSLIDHVGKFLRTPTERLKRYRSRVIIIRVARKANGQIFIDQIVLELLTPLKQASTLVTEYVVNSGVLKLKGVLKAIQIEMKQRDSAVIVHRHQGKRRTRNGRIISQPPDNALGEMRFSHSEAACKNQNVAILERGSHQLAQMLGILRRGRSICKSIQA